MTRRHLVSIPWELADVSPDGRTVTVRFVRFVRIRGRPRDPSTSDRLPRWLRPPAPLTKLVRVAAEEAADQVTISVFVKPRRAPEPVVQAFPKDGLGRVRLASPLGDRRIVHGPVTREAGDTEEELAFIREWPEGYGP
jgi:hypothetical protein